jgi:hypothetical protein
VFAPLGYAFAGPAAERFGLETTLLVAAGVAAAASVGILAVPAVRNLRRAAAAPEPARAAVLPTLRPDPAE